MKTSLRVEHPDQIEMTLTITQSLGDWKRLKGQLPSAFPSYKLVSAISDMVRQAEERFIPSVEEVPA